MTEKNAATKASEGSSDVACVGIDFGTGGCGFSYRLKGAAGSADEACIENEFPGACVGWAKVPTVIVTNLRGEFRGFGIQAISLFNNLETKEALAMFCWYKMGLYLNAAASTWQRPPTLNTDDPVKNEKQNLEEIMATALDGHTQVPLISLITWTLEWIAAYAINRLNRLHAGATRHNVQWVITVPAIWSQEARALVRKAATRADFFSNENQLRLCLEPDATALAMMDTIRKNGGRQMKTGDHFITCDLGCGTADFTAMTYEEIKAVAADVKFGDGKSQTGTHQLSEVLACSGGPWGSVYIDQQFVKLLDIVFGQVHMDKYRERFTGDWWRILRTFESKKHEEFGFSHDPQGVVIIELPTSFRFFMCTEAGLNLRALCDAYSAKTTTVSTASWFSWPSSTTVKEEPALTCVMPTEKLPVNYLRLSRQQFNALAQPVIEKTLLHTQKLYKEMCDKNKTPMHILLAGGLAECKPLVKAFEEWLAKIEDATKKPLLHRPGRGDVSVMKGAAIYAMNTRTIASRIMPWNLAYLCNQTVNAKEYQILCGYFEEPTSAIQWRIRGGVKRFTFTNALTYVTTRNQSYSVGHIVEESASLAEDGQENCTLVFYKTTTRPLLLTSDPKACEFIAKMEVKCPDKEVKTDLRGIDIFLRLSGTEFACASREVSRLDGLRWRNPWNCKDEELSRAFCRGTFNYDPEASALPPPPPYVAEFKTKTTTTGEKHQVVVRFDASPGEALETLKFTLLGQQIHHPLAVHKDSGEKTYSLREALCGIVFPFYCMVHIPSEEEAAVFWVHARPSDNILISQTNFMAARGIHIEAIHV